MKAFDCGINMELATRGTDTDKPWIVGFVKLENAAFNRNDDGYLLFSFYDRYDFLTEEENDKIYEDEIAKIEKFIEEHKNV